MDQERGGGNSVFEPGPYLMMGGFMNRGSLLIESGVK